MFPEHGDDFSSVLALLINKVKSSKPSVVKKSTERKEKQKRTRIDRLNNLTNDGRLAYRMLRRRLFELRSDATPKERTAFKTAAIAKIAREQGWQKTYANIAIKFYKKTLHKKLKKFTGLQNTVPAKL